MSSLLEHRALAFVKTFNSDASPREKVTALRTACKAHTELTKACAKGLGQDRLLYAMYCLAQQKEKSVARGDSSAPPSDSESSDSEDSEKLIARIPELFKDPGYGKLGSSTISTSNCGNPALRLFGFGPVAADGFGLGYIIKVSGHPCFAGMVPETESFPLFIRAGRLDCDLCRIETPTDFTFPRHSPELFHRDSQDAQTTTPRGEPQTKLCSSFRSLVPARKLLTTNLSRRSSSITLPEKSTRGRANRSHTSATDRSNSTRRTTTTDMAFTALSKA